MRFLAPLVLTLLTSCALGNSSPVQVTLLCPSIVEYSAELQRRAADEFEALPPDSALAEMIGDYGQLRERIRTCRSSGT